MACPADVCARSEILPLELESRDAPGQPQACRADQHPAPPTIEGGTILIYSAFSLLNALAWDTVSLGLFRFLTGVGLSSVVTAIFGLLYGATFAPQLIVTFGFLVTVSIQAFAPLLYAYSPELYPTGARASGSGFIYGVGRLANVLGPMVGDDPARRVSTERDPRRRGPTAGRWVRCSRES